MNFERVLLVKDGEKLSIGQPYVQGTLASIPGLSMPRPNVEQLQQTTNHPSIFDAHAMQRVWLLGLHRGVGAGHSAGGVPRKEADCL